MEGGNVHNSLNAFAFQHTLSKVWLMPVVYFLGKVIMLWSLAKKKKKAENNTKIAAMQSVMLM